MHVLKQDNGEKVMQILDSLIDNSISQSGFQKASNAAQALANRKIEDIDAAAKDFEAVFITQMIQQMFADVDVDPLFGGGNAEDVFKTFLFDEYGKILSNAGGIGVAESVKRELLKIQEV